MEVLSLALPSDLLVLPSVLPLLLILVLLLLFLHPPPPLLFSSVRFALPPLSLPPRERPSPSVRTPSSGGSGGSTPLAW